MVKKILRPAEYYSFALVRRNATKNMATRLFLWRPESIQKGSRDPWRSYGLLSLILTSVAVQKGSWGFEVIQEGSKGVLSGLEGSKSIKRDQKGSKLGI